LRFQVFSLCLAI